MWETGQWHGQSTPREGTGSWTKGIMTRKAAGRVLVWLEPRDEGEDMSYGTEGSEGGKANSFMRYLIFILREDGISKGLK